MSCYDSQRLYFCDKNKRVDSIGRLSWTYKPPHKPATSQIISRWIKSALSESGIEITVFSAHSVRHAATSAASAWTPSTAPRAGPRHSRRLRGFYNRPLSDERLFARSVCLPGTSYESDEPYILTALFIKKKKKSYRTL